jgi:hypothetical protein
MTISSNGKVAYVYQDSTSTWHPVAGTTSTGANYAWTGTHNFGSAVTLTEVLTAKAGVNNFLNTAARDAALPSPTNGIVCFVRQTDGGSVINQIQYYHNGEWRWSGDSADISLKTANYTITKEDAGKTINVSSESPTDITITIPANSTIPFINGQKIEIFRSGTGNVIIAGAVGVTINSKNSNKKIAAQYSGCVLLKTDTNTWLLIGDLTA